MSCMCRKCGGESVMVELDHVVEEVLKVINDNGFSQKGAFNLRQNGTSICHGDSEHIKIKKKADKPGIDIYIDGDTKGEKVYIPVVVSVSGMTDLVYNDFYIADGADVTIVGAAGSTTADAMRADMTGSTPFMLERTRTSVIRKNIMEREMEPAAVC